jgi:FG-GAP-like repeat
VPAGTGPVSVAVADFNNDGKVDMVVANNEDASVQVFLGNGDGTFKPQSPILLDGNPIAVAVGDFNGDGNVDVVVLTTDVFVLLGKGDGTFRIGGMVAAGSHVTSFVVADFNGDHKLDQIEMYHRRCLSKFRCPDSYQ